MLLIVSLTVKLTTEYVYNESVRLIQIVGLFVVKIIWNVKRTVLINNLSPLSNQTMYTQHGISVKIYRQNRININQGCCTVVCSYM